MEQLGTTDDCGFAPFSDDTSTSRDTAFAKIRARVLGTALADAELRDADDPPENEEALLRSVALQNAKAILEARQRAERELRQAKEALEVKSAELARSLAMLHATLESTTDGILVTDGGGAVIGFNEKLLSVLELSRAHVEAGTHHTLLDVIASRLADPHSFRERVEEIYATRPAESHDVMNASTAASSSGFHGHCRLATSPSDGSGAFATSRPSAGPRNS